MEGEKLTRLLRITFTLAETRQRKLEELERAIQSLSGAESRREQAFNSGINLAGEINSGDAGAIDGCAIWLRTSTTRLRRSMVCSARYGMFDGDAGWGEVLSQN